MPFTDQLLADEAADLGSADHPDRVKVDAKQLKELFKVRIAPTMTDWYAEKARARLPKIEAYFGDQMTWAQEMVEFYLQHAIAKGWLPVEKDWLKASSPIDVEHREIVDKLVEIAQNLSEIRAALTRRGLM